MGQPSLISEYDLGEGDLFKAPEPIIDEPPLLGLDDPVAAAISMMSNNTMDSMDDTMKASSMGLSEVLYECEKELMEKSAIEETISELLDVKIPMLRVPQLGRMDERVCEAQLSGLPGARLRGGVRAQEGLQRGRHPGMT
jgi:hypothetical protein